MIAALPLITSAISSILGSGQAASAASSVQSASSAGGDFTSMLAQFSNDTVNKLNTSETMSVASLSGGKATTQSVVEAVMSAQEALQTAVAVRDKAVSAFQEVTRMAI